MRPSAVPGAWPADQRAHLSLPALPEGDEFAFSPELWRVFCPACGTRLSAERPSAARVGIALAAFDDPDALAPECHFFVSSKISWVRLNDDLPQYPEWPPG
jgi:hypothetical protein